MPKIFIIPKRSGKPVELEGTLEKTDDGLIVKNIYGAVIGSFEPGCQWWTPEPPEPPAHVLKLSPTALEVSVEIMKAVRSGRLTDEQYSAIQKLLMSY